MTTTFRAHFDGKVVVPEEAVEFPLNETMELQVRVMQIVDKRPDRPVRIAALEQMFARPSVGAAIPDEALRREHLYDDRI